MMDFRYFCAMLMLAAAMGCSKRAYATDLAVRLSLTPSEIAKIVALGPWPPALKRDPSNRVSEDPSAIALGRAIFFDTRFSSSKQMSCASCHKPSKGWADGVARAVTPAGPLVRNTQSLVDARFNRWFGWDGQADSLWAQSTRPILATKEMNATALHVVRLLRTEKAYVQRYTNVFGAPPDIAEPEGTLVNVGKALAAFQETLVSARTPFDAFRDALAREDWKAATRYPVGARRGAKIFVGRGRCRICHYGPRFTSGEFHDAGVPYFIAPGKVDPGRYKGIAGVKLSPWNLTGRFNDDPKKAGAWATQQVAQLHRNFGEFRIPTLRGLTTTAPYMHNGSLPTLERVVQHYSQINIERLHADGERILVPLNLTAREVSDMVSFLTSLSPVKAVKRDAPLDASAAK